MQANSVDHWINQLTKAIREGTPLDLLARNTRPEPSRYESWGEQRRIPAATLRAVLLDLPDDADPHGLTVRGAWIDGCLDIEDARIDIPLTLTSCAVPDGIKGEGCRVTRLSLKESWLSTINLDEAQLRRCADFSGITTTGEVSAIGASIEGQLVLTGAQIANPDPKGFALDLDGATITGDVFANEGFTTIGAVRANGAHFGGALYLSGATLFTPGGVALNLDGATITEGMYANERFTVTGAVRALGISINGQLNLSGGNLTNSKGVALGLDGATIAGGVFATKPFTVTGEVRAVGITINGQLVLSGAKLTNPQQNPEHPTALNLFGATITGDVVANRGFTAIGAVRAVRSRIGGRLVLSGAKLRNPDRVALNLDGANVAGDVFANQGFTAKGEVRAVGSSLNRLVLSVAMLTNTKGDALNLDGAKVETLGLAGIAKCDGRLDLTACQIGDLLTGDQLGLPTLDSAAGCRVRDIHGLLRTDRKAAARWLDSSQLFTSQPWKVFASVYDSNGQPADARRLRCQAAHRTTRYGPCWSKLIRWLYAVTVGYGYYPLLAGLWLIGAIGVAGQLTASNLQEFLPTETTARALTAPAGLGCPPDGEPLTAATDPGCRAPGYPDLKPFTYAITTVTPASALAASAWAPTAPSATWINLALTGLKLFGWIMTALLLAGLTGLLREG